MFVRFCRLRGGGGLPAVVEPLGPLTLGTPALTIYFALSAGRGLLGGRGPGGGATATIHAGTSEIAALIVLAIVLGLALVAIEFVGFDTRGLPVYLVGIIALRLFLDAYAPHAPHFPGWLATIGIFALVAFFAIVLRLAATEEAGDIASTLKREPETARALVKQCLTPALNFIPAIVGVGLYGSVTGLR